MEEQNSVDALSGGCFTCPYGLLQLRDPVEGGGPRLRVVRELDGHRCAQLVDLVEGSATCVAIAKSNPRRGRRGTVLDVLLLGRRHNEIDVRLDGDVVIQPLLMRTRIYVDGRWDRRGIEPACRAGMDANVAPKPFRPRLVVAAFHGQFVVLLPRPRVQRECFEDWAVIRDIARDGLVLVGMARQVTRVGLAVLSEDGIERWGLVDVTASGNAVAARDIVRARRGLRITSLRRAGGGEDRRR
jgi:hypothetical protein